MSVFQRLLGTTNKEKIRQEKIAIPEVEQLSEGQPYNPYTEILLLQCHKDIIRLIIVVDDYRCATAGDDGKIVIWDIQDGSCLHVLLGHELPITSLIVHSDVIISSSSDKTVRIWDINSGECQNVLKDHNCCVKSLVPLIDSDLFVSGGEHISIWNIEGQLLQTYKRPESEEDICIMISVNNDRIVTVADKKLVVYGVKAVIEEDNENVDVELELIKTLPPHREVIHSLISVSKSCFASGSIDGMIVLWTAHNLLPAKYFNTVTNYQGLDKLYPHSIQCMFCIQEQYLFAAIGSGFCIFDLSASKDGLICRKLSAHFSKILNIGMTKDGSYLITSSEDGSIRLWGCSPIEDHETNEKENLSLSRIHKFTGLSPEEVKRLGGDNLFHPVLLGECSAHSGAVQTFCDYDKEGIVSCGADGLVIVWKNSEMQKVKRNRQITEMLANQDGII